MPEVTLLLQRLSSGDTSAANELANSVYAEQGEYRDDTFKLDRDPPEALCTSCGSQLRTRARRRG